MTLQSNTCYYLQKILDVTCYLVPTNISIPDSPFKYPDENPCHCEELIFEFEH